MDDARLPAHLEAAAIRRIAESLGGFATVLAKGERDGGTIAVVISCRGEPSELFERLPQPGGNRIFVRTFLEQTEKPGEFSGKIARRRQQDPDLWLIEVEVVDKERFVAALPR